MEANENIEEVERVQNQEQDQVKKVSSEDEAEARRYGWKPKEEYDGPQERWKPADEFLEFGRNYNSRLREENNNLRRDITGLKQEFGEFKKTASEIAALRVEAETRELNRQIDELKTQKREAISAGDGEKVIQLEDQIDLLKDKQKPVPKVSTTETYARPSDDEATRAWVEENDWFEGESPSDKEKTQFTMGAARRLKILYPDLKGHEFFGKLTEKIKEKFPEKKKVQNQMVEGSTRSGTRPQGGKTVNDLPPDARAYHDRITTELVNGKPRMTSKEYLELYFSQKGV